MDSTDGAGAFAASAPCSAPDIVATGPEAGSASVGGASSADGAIFMGTASVTAGGDEAVEDSMMITAGLRTLRDGSETDAPQAASKSQVFLDTTIDS